MIRIKSERVLLVAPDVFSVRLLKSNKKIMHVASADRIFPALFELNPNLIIFDYDHLNAAIEKVLRRIRSNAFYDRTRICCYNISSGTNAESLLITLGVNYIFYKDRPEANKRAAAALNSLKTVFDSGVLNLLTTAAY
jgi:hypothetical protein